MDAYESLLSRRSIRKYKKDAVPHEFVEKVVDAARHAPSGMNTQAWHFVVVEDTGKISEIGRFIQDGDADICYGAPVFIMVSYDERSPYAKEDSTCAMCAMMYAANALGLGSVWINRINRSGEKASSMQKFGVPEGYRVYGCLALGYADMTPDKRMLKKDTVTYIK